MVITWSQNTGQQTSHDGAQDPRRTEFSNCSIPQRCMSSTVFFKHSV